MNDLYDLDRRVCSLMMLVQRKGKMRLMQLVGDPTAEQPLRHIRLFESCIEFSEISTIVGQSEPTECPEEIR